MPRILADDRVEVLVDGVGSALIPVLADALLRRQNLDELASSSDTMLQPIRM